jgi:hypothetical protein
MLHEEVVSRPRAQNSTEGPHPRAGAVFAVPSVSHAVAGGVEGPLRWGSRLPAAKGDALPDLCFGITSKRLGHLDP